MPWAVPETVSPGKLMFDGVSLVKTTSEAPGIPGHPQTHRGGLQLARTVARFAQDAALRVARGRLAIDPRHVLAGGGPLQDKNLLAEKCHLGFTSRMRSEQSNEQSAEQLQEVDHPEARIAHRCICASPDVIFGSVEPRRSARARST
jgi:hypothetical protein